MFNDRQEAGKLLAQKIPATKNAVVLAIPRGGVEVGRAVANYLKAPLDIVVARKIGAPGNPELAIGAVTADGSIYLDRELAVETGADKEYIKKTTAKEQKEAKRRETLYRQGRRTINLKNKTAVIVDDGIATGATTRAAIKKVKDEAKEVILAVPVMPADLVPELSKEVDALIYLEAPYDFMAVGMFYRNFPQLTDSKVMELLKNSRA